MKKYVKDKICVCCNCVDKGVPLPSIEESEEINSTFDNNVEDQDDDNNDEEQDDDNNDEEQDRMDSLNKTYTVNKSMYFMDLTIDGFPAANFVAEEFPPRDEQVNDSKSNEGTEHDDSVSIHTAVDYSDSSEGTEVVDGIFECSQCTTKAPNIQGLQMHKQIEHSKGFQCHVCLVSFINKEKMLQHIDEEHFYSCPICESTFLRSFDKRRHMLENHEVNPVEFVQNIERHSTLNRAVEMKFVGDALNEIKDLKKTKKRTKGSK
jgi:hypothetical protein